MEPIQVLSGGNYFMMIDVEGTNAILVDALGAVTSVTIGSITVVDPNIFSKAKYINNNPPNTP
jgi:hypothetical protein